MGFHNRHGPVGRKMKLNQSGDGYVINVAGLVLDLLILAQRLLHGYKLGPQERPQSFFRTRP